MARRQRGPRHARRGVGWVGGDCRADPLLRLPMQETQPLQPRIDLGEAIVWRSCLTTLGLLGCDNLEEVTSGALWWHFERVSCALLGYLVALWGSWAMGGVLDVNGARTCI